MTFKKLQERAEKKRQTKELNGQIAAAHSSGGSEADNRARNFAVGSSGQGSFSGSHSGSDSTGGGGGGFSSCSGLDEVLGRAADSRSSEFASALGVSGP